MAVVLAVGRGGVWRFPDLAARSADLAVATVF